MHERNVQLSVPLKHSNQTFLPVGCNYNLSNFSLLACQTQLKFYETKRSFLTPKDSARASPIIYQFVVQSIQSSSSKATITSLRLR